MMAAADADAGVREEGDVPHWLQPRGQEQVGTLTGAARDSCLANECGKGSFHTSMAADTVCLAMQLFLLRVTVTAGKRPCSIADGAAAEQPVAVATGANACAVTGACSALLLVCNILFSRSGVLHN
jgi:hypothetical protein